MPNKNAPLSTTDVIQLYAAPSIILAGVIACLIWVVCGEQGVVLPKLIVSPMLALFALTAVVWIIMIVARNLGVILGKSSIRYFADFKTDVPEDDSFERIARVFNNLMQVPTLFYVICTLMFVTNQVDTAQITLAWLYVAFRGVHALIYMTVNIVPYRFATWVSSCIVLGVIWFRFGIETFYGG